MIDRIDKNKCNGCSACLNICPVRAIDMIIDQEGFIYPLIVKEKCIKCNRCDAVCPVLNYNKVMEHLEPQIYAAWSLNEEIRFNSTSGGVFSEFAMQILNKSGYVCGAIYSESYEIEHFITCDVKDLSRIRQSKYAQSNIKQIYKKIGKLLLVNNSVLFCGTPCQCAGLDSYLKLKNITRQNLVIIDFVCRGSNSPKVYQMFLKQLEKEHQSKITKVWFKNKTYGWNRFSTKIEFKNGNDYLKDRFEDSYIRGYIEANLFIRPSCGECYFKGFPRVSDITLGDFWGITLNDKNQNTDIGTSLIILNSDTGKKLFSKIKSNLFFEHKELNDMEVFNPCISKSIKHGQGREEFMKDLDKIDVIENINRYLT